MVAGVDMAWDSQEIVRESGLRAEKSILLSGSFPACLSTAVGTFNW